MIANQPTRRRLLPADDLRPGRPGGARRRLLVLLAGLTWLGALNRPARASTQEPVDSEYLVTVYDIEHGMPQNSATAITQTPDGSLWFSTWGGLARFDGKEFTTFSRLEAPELPSNRVVNLHLDRDGRLWVSTMRGMACVKVGTWTAFDKESGWVGDYVRAFAEGPSQYLYATTFNGKVIRFLGDRFEELPAPPGSVSEGAYPHIDRMGNLWIVTPQFVGRFVHQKWEETIPVSTWAKESFLGMASGRNGTLWIITKERVRQYSGRRLVGEWPGTGTAFGVWQAREDSQGGLWIGTMDHGVYRLTPDGAWRHLSRDNGLPSNMVRSVFEDREGSIWVGTDGGGLVCLRPQLFQVWGRARGLPEDTIMSIAIDKQERVYIGMFKEGVVCLEGKTIRRLCLPGSTDPWTGTATAMLVDKQGRLWVGGEGIHVFDGDKHRTFSPKQMGHHTVSLFLEDSRGQVWIGAYKGVYRFDGRDFQDYTLPGAPEEGTLAMGEDARDGTIWACGNVSGSVYRLRNDRFVAAPEVPAVKGSCFVGLLPGPDGSLWLGSERTSSLACLRGGRLTQITAANGLPNTRSLSPLVLDGSGNLWIGSEQGILRLPRAELEAVIAERRRELTAQLFTKEDGLPTRGCSSAGQPQGIMDSQGRLWFATVKGAVVLDPKRFRLNSAPPVLAIDKVLRDGVEVARRNLLLTSSPQEPDPIVVPPGTERLEIHYSALCLWGPDKVRYKYMVEGLDKDWIDVGNQQVAYLQPLRPGTYRFHVKAANNHGVWNETATTLVLEVQPFFSQTIWYHVLMVGGLMGGAGLAAWGITRARLRRQIERLEQQRVLAREQARLALVLEATSDLVAFLDESGNILYLNPAGRRMAGIRDEAGVKGLTVSGLHPRWAAELIRQEGIPTATRAGTWSGETAVLHGDGREIPVSQVIAVHKGPDGFVSFLSTIARDMSERKHAEEELRGSLREKEALLKEIHHRVKNNLQLVTSLLSLQAAQGKDAAAGDILAECRDRVRTMALVHENLYRAGNLASVPLASHVESLCAHLVCSYGAASQRIELDTHVEDVQLGLDRAIPCGLIINELVSNALKHAFPDGRAGRVSVAIHALPDRKYAMVVSDNGIGLPPEVDPFRAESMGLQLLNDLTEQLEGTLSVDRAGGTTFTIRFDAEPRGNHSHDASQDSHR